MKLVDLLSTATADFKGKVDNQINDMKKETISYIKEISNQDAQFIVELKDHAQKLQEEFAKDLENDNLDMWNDQNPDLSLLLEDRDMLNQHIESSKDFQEGRIQDKESEINRALTDDWKETMEKLLKEQHDRNRDIVKETIELTQEFREKISNFSDIIFAGAEFRRKRGEDDD